MSNQYCSRLEIELLRTPDIHQAIATPSLRNHFENCDCCRELFDELELIETAATHWKAATPTNDFTDIIVARLADSANTPSISPVVADRSPDSSRVSFVALSAVAILLLAVVFRSSPEVHPRSETDPSPDVVLDGDNNADEVTLPEPSFGLLDAGSVFVSLADGTANAFDGGANFVAGRDPDDPVNEKDALGRNGWMRGLRQSLAPYGRDLGQAADFLFEAEPDGESDEY
jgi:hypothetical protein